MQTFSLPQFTGDIQTHLADYPLAQPRDLVKFCYQRAFGASHFCGGEEQALQSLAAEYAALTPDPSAPLTEPLGGGAVRLTLEGAIARGLTPVQLARAFALDAARTPKDDAWFRQALAALEQLAEQSALPAACGRSMKEFLNLYRSKGCPPLHHSEVYRKAYHPHYRVFAGPLARLLPLMGAVSQRADGLAENRRLAVAMDGCCASGKTTAAEWLGQIFGAGVVHMDDFFLPPHLRTVRRYSQPGGNVHYERFSIQVAPRLPWRENFSYQRFDCSHMALGEWRTISAGPIVFVEGAYALHPACRGEYGLKVFFDVDPEQQHLRILARDGTDKWPRFRDEWIPMEHLYQEHFQIRGRADLIVE